MREPIPKAEAFRGTTSAHFLSQAAILLLIGYYLRADDQAFFGRAMAAGVKAEGIPPEHLGMFPVPQLRLTGERFDPVTIRSHLKERFGVEINRQEMPAGQITEILFALAESYYARENLLAAAELLEACLWLGTPLTQVAAAFSYLELTTDPGPPLDILMRNARSPEDQEPLTRSVAQTALARVDPRNTTLPPQDVPPRPPREESRTTLIIHGTFAANEPWWQPGGDFFEYIRGDVYSDAYGGTDRFRWSGGYAELARLVGAYGLREWCNQRQESAANLIGHSHGANVILLATQFGLTAETVVLLSCPVHFQYAPHSFRANKYVSFRVIMDLVILADGGGQVFAHPSVSENVLPIWFNHADPHNPAVWAQYALPNRL